MVQWVYLSCIILPTAPKVNSSKPGPFYFFSFLTVVVTATNYLAGARKTAGGLGISMKVGAVEEKAGAATETGFKSGMRVAIFLLRAFGGPRKPGLVSGRSRQKQKEEGSIQRNIITAKYNITCLEGLIQ